MNSPTAASPWLHSRVTDLFWMHSGLWLPLLLLALLPFPGVTQGLLLAAVFLLWLPHRFATTFNAFCTPAYHRLLNEQRLRFLWIPAGLVGATFLFVFAPSAAVPLDLPTRVHLLATLFFLYNSWHFAMQHYGVLSIYRQRSGQPPGGWLKRFEKQYCLAVGMVAVVIAQIGHGAEVVRDSLLYETFPREQSLWLWELLRYVVPVITIALTTVFLIGELRMPQRSIPKILYVSAVAIQSVLAYWIDAASFVLLWGVQHWLVSIALTAHMAENDRTEIPAASGWYGFWRGIAGSYWPTVVVLTVGSVALVPLFDLTVHPHNAAKLPLIAAVCEPLLANTAVNRLFLALNFATVYVHFAMDQAVFRFSDPAVRKVTGTLLFARAKP